MDREARVLFGGAPSPNLAAAGELMAGNVLGKGYLAGIGMTIGTAFGRLAGRTMAAAVEADLDEAAAANPTAASAARPLRATSP